MGRAMPRRGSAGEPNCRAGPRIVCRLDFWFSGSRLLPQLSCLSNVGKLAIPLSWPRRRNRLIQRDYGVPRRVRVVGCDRFQKIASFVAALARAVKMDPGNASVRCRPVAGLMPWCRAARARNCYRNHGRASPPNRPAGRGARDAGRTEAQPRSVKCWEAWARTARVTQTRYLALRPALTARPVRRLRSAGYPDHERGRCSRSQRSNQVRDRIRTAVGTASPPGSDGSSRAARKSGATMSSGNGPQAVLGHGASR
jgi:hypothetical protein